MCSNRITNAAEIGSDRRRKLQRFCFGSCRRKEFFLQHFPAGDPAKIETARPFTYRLQEGRRRGRYDLASNDKRPKLGPTPIFAFCPGPGHPEPDGGAAARLPDGDQTGSGAQAAIPATLKKKGCRDRGRTPAPTAPGNPPAVTAQKNTRQRACWIQRK